MKFFKIILLVVIFLPIMSSAEGRVCQKGSRLGSFDYGACIEAGGDLGDIFKSGSPGNLRWSYCQRMGSECEFPGNKTDQELQDACNAYVGVIKDSTIKSNIEKQCGVIVPKPKVDTSCYDTKNSLGGLGSGEQKSKVFSCLGIKPDSLVRGTKPSYCGNSSRGYYFEHLDELDKEYGLDDNPTVPRRERDSAYLAKAKYYSCLGGPCEFYGQMNQAEIEENILSCYGVTVSKPKPTIKPVELPLTIKPTPKVVLALVEPVGVVGDGAGKGSVPGNSASLPSKAIPANTECVEAKGGSGVKSDCLISAPEKAISVTDAEQLVRERGEDEVIKEIFKIKVGNVEKQVAIIRDRDGIVRYSTNGRDWMDSLRTLMKPTVVERLTSSWNNFWNRLSPGSLFHTADKDADREEIWQIGKRQLSDLRKVAKSDILANRLKNAAGDWIKDQGKSLAGKAGISVEAVELLAGQLNNDRFAQALRIYINDRQAGKSSGNIAADPPPELLASQMTDDSGNDIPNAALYSVYEDSYQRFLLNKKLRAGK